jgi:hypothetical protein
VGQRCCELTGLLFRVTVSIDVDHH